MQQLLRFADPGTCPARTWGRLGNPSPLPKQFSCNFLELLSKTQQARLDLGYSPRGDPLSQSLPEEHVSACQGSCSSDLVALWAPAPLTLLRHCWGLCHLSPQDEWKKQERQRQEPSSTHRHVEKPPEHSPAVAGQQQWVAHQALCSCHSESAV